MLSRETRAWTRRRVAVSPESEYAHAHSLPDISRRSEQLSSGTLRRAAAAPRLRTPTPGCHWVALCRVLPSTAVYVLVLRTPLRSTSFLQALLSYLDGVVTRLGRRPSSASSVLSPLPYLASVVRAFTVERYSSDTIILREAGHSHPAQAPRRNRTCEINTGAERWRSCSSTSATHGHAPRRGLAVRS